MRIVTGLICSRKREGFSLIELLVALVIAVSVVLGFGGGTLAVMRSNRVSEQLSQATALAQERLALFKAASSCAWAAGSVEDEGFQIQWEAPAAGPQTDTCRLTVSVSWSDSQTHTISFETVLREG